MKNILLTLILSCMAFVSTNATVPTTLSINEREDIDLKGKNKDDREKTLVIPFQASLIDNQEVEILSYHACTDVTISICTISGQVLDSQTLSFASMQSVTFNIGNYAEGYYLVKINTPSNTEYSGTFMIE